MLERLRIHNLSVVEDVELTFGPGLNVLTGSTGAGKSLILGAVNLLLGERVSGDLVRAGESRAEVEAEFSLPAGLDALATGGNVVLRREVRSGCRSQAWIDGAATTLRELHRVASLLVEPHGQNEQYRLRNRETHVEYVDAYARNAALRERYRKALERFRSARRALDEFERRVALIEERRELLEHRVGEVERAALQAGEKEELERSLRVLENVDRIHAALNYACEALYDSEDSALALVARARKQVREVAGIDPTLAGYVSEIEGGEIPLRECVDAMRSYLDHMEFDPEQLQVMQERLDVLIALERRYGMSADQLIVEAAQWREELDSVALQDDRRETLRDELEASARSVAKEAAALGASRRSTAAKLDRKMTAELQELMMKGAEFRTHVAYVRESGSAVEIDGVGVALLDHGADDVHMHVRTNPGEPEGALDRIASTGEVSRIALALKGLTNAGNPGSVMVFDEIDAGVGADLGSVIAEKLLELSRRYQIICITHMPQIAAHGSRHMVVSKHTRDGRTVVDVALVDGTARRGEIARMLGGEEGSGRRLALADELLEKNARRVRP